jgi:hypothetical protein
MASSEVTGLAGRSPGLCGTAFGVSRARTGRSPSDRGVSSAPRAHRPGPCTTGGGRGRRCRAGRRRGRGGAGPRHAGAVPALASTRHRCRVRTISTAPGARRPTTSRPSAWSSARGAVLDGSTNVVGSGLTMAKSLPQGKLASRAGPRRRSAFGELLLALRGASERAVGVPFPRGGVDGKREERASFPTGVSRPCPGDR